MNKKYSAFFGLVAILVGTSPVCSAQNLEELLSGAGIDPATLGQAQAAMGANADPVAAREYSDGTKAGMAGDMDSAIAHLSRAVALAPNFTSAHFNLACAHARKGNKAKALASLANAIRLDQGYKAKARAESDFSSLSADPQFLALVG